jgi:hypothetical protein
VERERCWKVPPVAWGVGERLPGTHPAVGSSCVRRIRPRINTTTRGGFVGSRKKDLPPWPYHTGHAFSAQKTQVEGSLYSPTPPTAHTLLTQIKQCEPLEESELEALCGYVKEVLVEESNVQPVNSPVTVCGDIHGGAVPIACEIDWPRVRSSSLLTLSYHRYKPDKSRGIHFNPCTYKVRENCFFTASAFKRNLYRYAEGSSTTCSSCSKPAATCRTPTTSSW